MTFYMMYGRIVCKCLVHTFRFSDGKKSIGNPYGKKKGAGSLFLPADFGSFPVGKNCEGA